MSITQVKNVGVILLKKFVNLAVRYIDLGLDTISTILDIEKNPHKSISYVIC